MDDIDEGQEALRVLGYLGAFLHFYQTQEGSVSAALARLGLELEEAMTIMQQQGKPYQDVLDALLESVAVYEVACQDSPRARSAGWC